jgi:predicted PurR-regulated permease PerM
MHYTKLKKTVSLLFLFVLVVVILKFGAPFLIPITFGGLLAMLLLPFTKWLERKGVSKALATLLSTLILAVSLTGLIAVMVWQASQLTEDASRIEKEVSGKIKQVQQFVSEKLGVPPDKQEQMLKEQQSSAPGKLAGTISGIVAGIGGVLFNTVLVLVYVFLLLYFRGHIKRFILRLVRTGDEENARDILDRSQKVTQKYLSGYAMMIVMLWIMYGIGFSIAGVKNPIFFAVVCGVLEIVPLSETWLVQRLPWV